MHRLADESIALVLRYTNGRFKARLEGATSGNVLLRQAQHALSTNVEFSLQLARACVAGKIKNARQVILRGARETKGDDERQGLERLGLDLAASLRALPGATTLDELRGVEGDAARKYFGGLALLVREDQRGMFRMEGRSKRPPRDRINALLSFVYSMWMNDCRSACEAAGLDPQVGFLHSVRPGRAALALDLVEEFRPIADRLVLTLVNRCQIDADDSVHREGGAVLLEGDARKSVVVAYQERKQEVVTHPLLKEQVPLGLIPFVQARLLARAIRNETAGYLPYTVR